MRVKVKCFHCRKTFYKKWYNYRISKRHFCSKTCWLKGHAGALIIGKRYGKLTVLRRYKSHGNFRWICKCDCGKIIKCSDKILRYTRNCGCAKPIRYEDLSGRKYGRLTVIRFHHIGNKGQRFYLCKCSCGATRIIYSGHLKKNIYKSCGCLKIDSPHHILPPGRGGFNILYHRYIVNCSKSRGLIFNLSKAFFRAITGMKCYYCGQEPNQVLGKIRGRLSNHTKYVYNGIDRIDNTKGYTKNNVVPCCKICNRMKNVSSKEDFLKHVYRIVHRLKLKNIDSNLNNNQSRFETLLRMYRQNARYKKYAFRLTKKLFRKLTRRNCHYCGSPPASFIKGRNSTLYQYNGIDRVDNKRGYIEDNVVTCCIICNRLKSNMSVSDFINHMRKVAKKNA